jgi:hypothetical protein
VEKTFAFGAVERALLGVFGVKDDGANAFAGRLQFLRKSGLPSDTPGKGKPLGYRQKDVDEIVLALQFELIGIPPAAGVRFVKNYEERLTKLARDARKATQDMCIIVEANPASPFTGPFYLDPSGRKAHFSSGDINALWEFLARGANGFVLNLTDLFRRLDSELAAARPSSFVASMSRRSLRTKAETLGNIGK